MASLRAHLSYANLMATVAVFCAIGGTAWALSANSVGSRQLKPKAVRTSDLAPNAVTSPKVKNGSLRRRDFAAGQIPAGPTGPEGDQGIQGPSALRLDFDQPETDDTLRVLGTQNELTIKARCSNLAAIAILTVHLNSSVSGEFNYLLTSDTGGTPSLMNGGGPLVAASDTFLFSMGASGIGGWKRGESQVIYRNAGRVISIHLHMRVDDLTDRCQVQGIAIPAS